MPYFNTEFGREASEFEERLRFLPDDPPKPFRRAVLLGVSGNREFVSNAVLEEVIGHLLGRVFSTVVGPKSSNLDVTDESVWCFILLFEVFEAIKNFSFVFDEVNFRKLGSITKESDDVSGSFPA